MSQVKAPGHKAGHLAAKTQMAVRAAGKRPEIAMMNDKMINKAKFSIGELVRHRVFPFRGVIFDVDPEFANSEEWYESIPDEIRPRKDQPFYHLFAENDETEYIAYVSEQNLLSDENREPVRHPQVSEVFERRPDGNYRTRERLVH